MLPLIARSDSAARGAVVIGPSLIALGLSIGSGEWILASLAIGTNGWVGIGFVALLSILLQAFYNVEIGRYVVATGEVPSLGFGRIPPGFFIGTILAIVLFYLAFITGGWAAGAGDGLFTFITGDIPGDEDQNATNWLAVGLMAFVFVITLFGRKLSRSWSWSTGSSSCSSSRRSSSPRSCSSTPATGATGSRGCSAPRCRLRA